MTSASVILHQFLVAFFEWPKLALGRARDERGDVPGWVLIAVMTVGLVMMIWAIAGPALSGLFNNAIGHVRII